MTDQTTPSPTTENGDIPDWVARCVETARRNRDDPTCLEEATVLWFADRTDARGREGKIIRTQTGEVK